MLYEFLKPVFKISFENKNHTAYKSPIFGSPQLTSLYIKVKREKILYQSNRKHDDYWSTALGKEYDFTLLNIKKNIVYPMIWGYQNKGDISNSQLNWMKISVKDDSKGDIQYCCYLVQDSSNCSYPHNLVLKQSNL